MAYFVIENFSNGMDLRRSADTAPAGSLRMLKNAFINQGGEIEKRKSFANMPNIEAYTLDATYQGLVSGPVLTPNAYGSIAFIHSHDSVYTDVNFTADNAHCSRAELNEFDEAPFQVTLIRQAEVALNTANAMRHVSSHTALFGRVGQQYVAEYSPSVRYIVDYPIHVTYDVNGRIAQGVQYISENFNHEDIFVLDQKGYSIDKFSLYFSAVGDLTDWAGTGSGVIDLNTLSSHPIGELMRIEEYYGQLAVMGRRAVQLWDTDPDPDLNQYRRTIPISPVSARATHPYTSGDVLYLDRSGVRSLRARELSENAEIEDVGSPIDSLIESALDYGSGGTETVKGQSFKPAEFNYLATSAVLEQLGQYWLFLQDKIYVLSSFKDAKVRAWSVYDLPAPTTPNPDLSNNLNKYCADACATNGTIIFRNFGDNVWLYGGSSSQQYDTAPVEVITPHMDFGRPGTEKDFIGMDMACMGQWTIEVSFDVNNIVWEEIATVENSTHRLTGRIPIDGRSTHIALRLTTTSALQAKVGQITIYYNDGGDR